jgi:hypothetical protein
VDIFNSLGIDRHNVYGNSAEGFKIKEEGNKMKYRISQIRTKEQFQKAHKKQWNLIIKNATNSVQGLEIIKILCHRKLFDKHISGSCFGCHWRDKKPKHKCLFNIRKPCDDTIGCCLDGLYYKASTIFYGTSKADKIKIAEKIRDFPIA